MTICFLNTSTAVPRITTTRIYLNWWSGAHAKADLLANGYPFGIAQKLLNVYLKYQWCSGWIFEPPHCPIDRTILQKLTLENRFIWTTMNESDYRAAIDELKKVARDSSPAQWELIEFRRVD